MASNFGKGIKVTSGFDLSAESPLDNRTVVETIKDRDEHVTESRVYAGLKVFVVSEKKEYLYDGIGWVESGGLTDEQITQLMTAYMHALSDHVSKELIDEEFESMNNKINDLPSKEMVNSKADLTHAHDDRYYTIDDIDQKLSDIATGGLIDLESYAKKAEVEAGLASKAELGHGHSASDIDGLSEVLEEKANKNEVASKEEVQSKADIVHNHELSQINGLEDSLNNKAEINNVYDKASMDSKLNEINNGLNSKSDIGHNHNDMYYTQSEVNERIATAVTDGKVDLTGYAKVEDLATKADLSHGHTSSDIEGLSEVLNAKADKADIAAMATKGDLAGKSDIGHSHDISNITDLQETLNEKANANNVYDKANIDNKFESTNNALTGKADISHNHNDVYYTQSEVDEKIATAVTDGKVDLSGYARLSDLATKADLGHGHTMSDVEGLSDALDNKANKNEVAIKEDLAGKSDIGHTHDISSINELQEHLEAKANTNDVYTKVEIDNKVQTIDSAIIGKADVGHNHDDVYYTQAEVDEAIAKVATDGVVNLQGYATKTELNEGLQTKADLSHGHTPSDIEGLDELFGDSYSKKEVDDAIALAKTEAMVHADTSIANLIDSAPEAMNTLNELAEAIDQHQEVYEAYIGTVSQQLAGKSDIGHDHNNEYYTKEQVQELIDTGIDGVDLSKLALKSELQEGLNSKSDLGHGHEISEIVNLTEELESKMNKGDAASKEDISEIESTLSGKADINHTHDIYADKEHTHKVEEIIDLSENYYNKNEIDANLSTKAELNHNHNDAYYTKNEVDNKIEASITDVNLNQYATINYVNNELMTKADLAHGHTFSDIENLQEELDKKANKTDAATKEDLAGYAPINHLHDDRYCTPEQVDEKIAAVDHSNYAIKSEVEDQLAIKSDIGHNHNDMYYTQEQVDDKIQSGIDGVDLSNLATKSELEDGLAVKSDLGHNHNDIYYTQEQVDDKIQSGIDGVDLSGFATKSELQNGLATKAELNHTHDYAEVKHEHTTNEIRDLLQKFYIKTDIDDALGKKADIGHTHDDLYSKLDHVHKAEEIDGLLNDIYDKSEIDTMLSAKSDVGHGHNIEEIDGLQEELELKANKADAATKEELAAAKKDLEDNLALKSELNHNHDDRYFTQEQVNEKINEKIGDIDFTIFATKEEVETGLASKAELAHTHELDDVIGLIDELDLKADKSTTATTEYVLNEVNRLEQAISSKAELIHTHNDIYYTKSEVDDKISDDISAIDFSGFATKEEVKTGLAGKSDLGHTHDYSELDHKHTVKDITDLFDNVYNKTEIDNNFAIKANINHNHDDVYAKLHHEHELKDLNGLDEKYYTKTEIDNTIAGYSPLGHGHSITEISGLVEELNLKADVATTATKIELQSGLNGKAELNHNHDDVYSKLGHNHAGLYLTESQIDTKIQNNQDNAMTEIEAQYQAYTNQKIAELVDGAPEAMNTLNELAGAINAHQNVYDAYVNTITQQLAGKSNIDHNHNDIYYTKSEIDDTILDKIDDIDLSLYALKTDLEQYSLATHQHDSRYYLKYQVDAKIAGLGIAGYAKLEDLQKWGELFALKEHTHDDLSVTVELSDVAVQNMLKDVFGFYHGEA